MLRRVESISFVLMLVIDKNLSMQSISNQNANGYIVNVLSLPTSTVIEKIFAAPKGQ